VAQKVKTATVLFIHNHVLLKIAVIEYRNVVKVSNKWIKASIMMYLSISGGFLWRCGMSSLTLDYLLFLRPMSH